MFELYIIIGTLSFKLLHHLFLTPAVEPFPVISVHDRVLYYNVTWNEPVSDFLCIEGIIIHILQLIIIHILQLMGV